MQELLEVRMDIGAKTPYPVHIDPGDFKKIFHHVILIDKEKMQSRLEEFFMCLQVSFHEPLQKW